MKNEKSFAKYSKAGRKREKKGNLNRGNCPCKGTRLVTMKKRRCLECLGRGKYRVHKKPEERQERRPAGGG